MKRTQINSNGSQIYQDSQFFTGTRLRNSSCEIKKSTKNLHEPSNSTHGSVDKLRVHDPEADNKICYDRWVEGELWNLQDNISTDDSSQDFDHLPPDLTNFDEGPATMGLVSMQTNVSLCETDGLNVGRAVINSHFDKIDLSKFDQSIFKPRTAL